MLTSTASTTSFERNVQLERVRIVLLVEDDGEFRALVAFALRRHGIAVIEAPDAGVALNYLEVAHDAGGSRDGPPVPDVLLCDVLLPGRSGLSLLRELDDRALQIIVMTAYADAQLHAAARRLGARWVFEKPFDLDDLVTAVHAAAR